MRSLSRNAVLALIGVTLVLHTTEEYLTFPAYLASANQLPRFLPPPALMQNLQNLRIALLAATVLPLAVIAWAIWRPRKALLVAVLFLECILLINSGWHVFAACVRGGYAPGVITAVLINLPFGVYVLRRSVKDQWIPARTAWLLLGIALVVHLAAAGTFLAG
ncbi:MAG: HXXEE domain-containing protein [Candidatus Korobacteraceae bacterium]|jgi:hypothetical protein